jgi:hypothetical protein
MEALMRPNVALGAPTLVIRDLDENELYFWLG